MTKRHERFTGDLWQCDRRTLETAALEIVERRGHQGTKVYRLTSGLWVEVRLTNGEKVRVMDDEIRRHVWERNPPAWRRADDAV